MQCPCGSSEQLENCCEPFIEGKKLPETAEKLMRSRYTAFALEMFPYLKNTLAPEIREKFDIEAVKKEAAKLEWLSLQILSTSKGGEKDRRGTVEFAATYSLDDETFEQHEVSHFEKTSEGQWLYSGGDAHTHREGESHHHEKQAPVVRESPKTGRNDPCPCGSGKKFKKCCGALT